jgi:hypothetical protein
MGQTSHPKKLKNKTYVVKNLTLAPDSAVSKFLGAINQKNIFAPDKVILYTINPVKKPDTATIMLSRFVIKEKLGGIDKQLYFPLQLIMQDNNFYQFDNIYNKCLFTPDVAFEFIKKSEVTIVYVSLGCEQIGIEYKGNLKVEEFNYHTLLLKYLKQILPNDEFIQKFNYIK